MVGMRQTISKGEEGGSTLRKPMNSGAIRGTEAMGSTAYHLHSVHMLHSRQLLLDYY